MIHETQSSELIDTLWNVNPVKACEEYYVNLELIDTYWNVDYYHN